MSLNGAVELNQLRAGEVDCMSGDGLTDRRMSSCKGHERRLTVSVPPPDATRFFSKMVGQAPGVVFQSDRFRERRRAAPSRNVLRSFVISPSALTEEARFTGHLRYSRPIAQHPVHPEPGGVLSDAFPAS